MARKDFVNSGECIPRIHPVIEEVVSNTNAPNDPNIFSSLSIPTKTLATVSPENTFVSTFVITLLSAFVSTFESTSKCTIKSTFKRTFIGPF